MSKNISIKTKYKKITYILTSLVIFLSVGHVVAHIPNAIYGYSGEMFGLFRFFNLGAETSLATYVSALIFLLAGGLLSLVALHESDRKSGSGIYWWGLAAGFLVMSFDESTQIHERIVGSLTRYLLGAGEGVFHFGWTRAYIPLVVVIAFVFFPFIRRIGTKYTAGFVLSGIVFLSGAIGLEMAGSYISAYNISVGEYESVRILMEESLEMFGVVIFIHFVSMYISEEDIDTIISISLN